MSARRACRFANADARTRPGELPEVGSKSAEDCHYRPDRQSNRNDWESRPALRHASDRDSQNRIEGRECDPTENSQLGIGESKIAFDRLREDVQNCPVRETRGVNQGKEN